jgi:SAM-dependent methyltransferase
MFDPDPSAAAVVNSYDAIAGAYAEQFVRELEHKPLDRRLLDRVASAAKQGRVADLGSGPGHVARYLHDRGADVVGIDLSPRMVAEARRLNPGLEFLIADLRALPLPDRSITAAVAFYSLIHLRPDQLVAAFTEIGRVLKDGGQLLASFHRGREVRHLDELLGRKISLDFYFYEPADIEAAIHATSLTIEEIATRDPYPDVEAQTERFYVRALQRSGRSTPSQSEAVDHTRSRA